MTRPTAMIVVAALFVVGVLVGALGTHLLYADRLRAAVIPDRPGGHEVFDRIEHELGLTPEQKERIEEILQESRAAGRAIHRELLPRVQSHLDSTRMRIAEILTPEQREKFEELHRNHHRAAEHWFLGRGLGPPPHARRHGRRHGGPPPIESESPPAEEPPPPQD